MKKKRLLVFHISLVPYRIDFFNSLSEKFDAQIYYLQKESLSHQFNQQSLIERVTHTFKYLTKGFNLKHRPIRFGILKIIKNYKPDIILTSEFNLCTITVFLIKKLIKPSFKLYTIVDDSEDRAMNCKGIRRYVRNYMVKKLDGIIFSNVKTLNWFGQSFKTKTNFIESPIIQNDELFRNELKESKKISRQYIEKYGLINKKIILFVGRLVKIKGIDRLIAAYSKINAANTDSVLVIVGDGQEKENLKQLTNNLGINKQVLFVGRFEFNQLYAWYLVANLLVLPSHWEAFGAVVNESLLCGIPVLCSNLAGAAELIKPGFNGDVFNPFNINKLSDLIDMYLQQSEPLILKDNDISIKPNLMPFSFDEKMEILCKQIY